MVYHYSDCAGGPQYGGHEVLETSVLSRPKRSVERTKVVRYTMVFYVHMNICHFYFAAEISPFFLHFPDFHRMIIPIARLTSSLVSAI